MILVTGGLGFIGTHTTRALLALGESCVAAQRRPPGEPPLLGDGLGERLSVERLDIADGPALLALSERHEIDGIVHLASPGLGERGLLDDWRLATEGLLNVLRAAEEWGVSRVTVASTIGVYAGARDRPLHEDEPLPLTGFHSIPAFKKSAEVLTSLVAGQTDLDVVNVRIAAIWGPLGTPESPFFALPRLVHAAVKGEPADFTPPRRPAHAGDAIDACYVKDCARAIALVHRAEELNHDTYNVASGRATTNTEVIDAVRAVIPEADIELPEGRSPDGLGPDAYLDITRISEDTGYEPAYGLDRGVSDYIEWLWAGNDR